MKARYAPEAVYRIPRSDDLFRSTVIDRYFQSPAAQ
jgi:hypothetical protein